MTQYANEEEVTAETEALTAFDADIYVFPTSYSQQRLWFLDQFEPGSAFYNIPIAVRVTGPLRCDLLAQTMQAIVDRHESLRTTFAMMDGEPVQVVHGEWQIRLDTLDLQTVPPTMREAEMHRLALAEAQAPFNLTTGPLLRIKLLQMAVDEHILLLTMHHIISDAWSTGLFMREVDILYHAFVQGESAPLPPLPIQYADFAEWQREWLQGAVLEAQLHYWKTQLGNNPPVLRLPTDRPRPAIYTTNGAIAQRLLPQSVGEALHTLSRNEKCTLFMTLLAAFQTLLYRYTGQDDICVGTAIANRNRAEIEEIIGVFINTLVLRTTLTADNGQPLSFRALLQRVREVALGAYAHQDLPFEKLVEEINPERDMSHTPLFQVMFILENTPMGEVDESVRQLQLTSIQVDPETSNFDLTLTVVEEPMGMRVVFEYNTDLFNPGTIERMLEQFETLLTAIVANPDQSIATLPLLTDAVRQQQLVTWNATAAAYPLAQCSHHLFEAQATQQATTVAVVFNDQQLTYGELNARANQLAHYLRQLGVGPEVLVGICVERSLEMIVGVLGVLKAGGAYVPLDPNYPEVRLAHMINDTQASVILTQEHCGAALPTQQAQVIYLDRDWETISRQPSTNPITPVTAENLAYIIYTSGSTGQSKGAMIRHSSLVNAFYAWRDAYGLGTVVTSHLQMASFSFDVFSGDWIRALGSGGKLVLCPFDLLLQPEPLYALMVSEGVDCAEFVPAVLRNLIQYLEESGQNLAFMRVLIAGSDSWYAGEYAKFLRFCGPQTRLINSFGLTEATIDSSYYENKALALAVDRVVPIGRPYANMQIYLLDSYLQPVPIGVHGEIYIGGAGLARGYYNRPELTAEKFVPHPFSCEAGARLYKTGDLALYLPDGNIEFIGRIDHQVKIRGLRIELGEIEARLGQHPLIQQVAVTLYENGSAPGAGDRILVAYFVSSAKVAPTANELRRFLVEKLPDYMAPSAFVQLEQLPLTPNGKIDRRALPAPTLQPREADEFIAPRTPTEELLAGIWMRILGVSQVSIDDNFFAIGGHSLLATQVNSRLRDAFGVELPLRNIFEFPTVATLAEQIEQVQATQAGMTLLPLTPVARDGRLPLSFAQERLWVLDQLNPGSPAYNIAEAYHITGPLHLEMLAASINGVIKRHEILRTTFRLLDDEAMPTPVQVIAPVLRLPLPLIDLRHLSAPQRTAEVARLAEAEARYTFDLARGPLLRTSVLRLSEEEHVILLTLHHIISDDWSSFVYMGEIAVLYNALMAAPAGLTPTPLPPLPIQYADYAHWQRTWLQGEVLETQLNYWKAELAGIPPLLELPIDHARPAVLSSNGKNLAFTLSADLAHAVKALSAQEGVTLFMTLLAAFQTLLHRYSGQDDICVGSPITNRTRSELEGLIGFFVNTLVMRTDLGGNPSSRVLLQRVRAMALDAYAHQDLPFERLVSELHPDRDLSRTPIFQVMFVMQNIPNQTAALAQQGLQLRTLDVDEGIAKFDLTLFMTESDGQLSGTLNYNSDLFAEQTISRMVRHFETLLTGMVANPDCPIGRLQLMTEAELAQQLVTWNGGPSTAPLDQCLHELFEAQVTRTPAAIAATFGTETLSYHALNTRVNQLAHYLRTLGVGQGAGREALVGVCMERSIDLLVALLGVLKAGGAYVPLDPNYPVERLAYMLDDANVMVLLTQAQLLDQLPAHRAKTVCLARDWPLIAGHGVANPPHTVTSANLAYVIYTSGSTGKPKGTLITHRGLTNYLHWCLHAYPVAEGEGSLVHSTFAFDATVTALFSPLLVGRTVHLLPETDDLEALSAALGRLNNLSLVKITPAHLTLLNQQITPAQAATLTRAFVIGGENLTSEQIAFWQQHAPDTLLFNEYGPTETVVGCVVFEAAQWRGSGSVPIGRAIPGMRAYVLDHYLQPTPLGAVGELYLGGEGVARGYLNRPAITAEKFLPDPFSTESGARLYRTGDLVRFVTAPDGSPHLEFLGRIDDQVKIRGYRVELGEVEAILSQHEQVRECVVIARQTEAGVKQLVAYWVANSEQPSVSALRDFMQTQLPEYMVPALFIVLAALPLTSNGKVNRKALPAPQQVRLALENAFVAPRTHEEEVLTRIWAEVLGVAQVGVQDNFFELGGDSIQSIQVVARANQVGLRLTPAQLFQYPTVAALALEADTATSVLAEQGIVTGPLPLTPIQLWFFEQQLPDPHHWNWVFFQTVNQKLDPKLLAQTVQHLVGHHDALRLRFQQTTTGWQSSNASVDDPVPFQLIDLAGMTPEAQRTAIESTAATLQTSLNLTDGPLLQVAYFELGGKQSNGAWPAQHDRLLIILHHLVVDGISVRVLMEDLQLIYGQLSHGQAVQLPLKTTSFRQWAHRLWDYAQTPALKAELHHWLALTHRTALALPVDYPAGHGENTVASARTVTVALSETETHALLHEVPEAYRTQINDVLLTALVEAISEWRGVGWHHRSLLLDLEGHGRETILGDDLDVSRTVGWFTSLFPVHLDLEGIFDPGDALMAVKEQLRAIPNHGLGYGLLRYLCSDPTIAEQVQQLPKAAINFNYLGQFDQGNQSQAQDDPKPAPFSPASESMGLTQNPAGRRPYLLEIVGSVAAGALALEWIYSEHVHQRTTIERLAQSYLAALRQIIEHCQLPEAGGVTPSDFSLVSLDRQSLNKILGQVKVAKE